MRCARSSWWFWIGCLAIGMLQPSPAWADALDGAFAAVELMLAQLLGALLGLAAMVAALRSRSRGVWLFALAVAAGNGVTGVIALSTTRAVLPFILPASLQVVLGVVVGPCLVLWRQAEVVSGESAPQPRRSRRWLVLWILGNTAMGLLALAVMPLVARVLPLSERGSQVSPVHLLLLVTGVVNGVLFGAMQWILLRNLMGVSATWIALTTVGSAVASLTALSISAPALSLPLSGAIVGAAQWPVLRERLNRSWLWVPLGALLGLLTAPLVVLQAESRGGLVFLMWLMHAFDALVTGVVLQRLARPRSDWLPGHPG